jgi:hypothetical protein
LTQIPLNLEDGGEDELVVGAIVGLVVVGFVIALVVGA